ncbi:MAG: mRNA surveillance protein pelota, partial [Desulfurococcaceae archaeon]
ILKIIETDVKKGIMELLIETTEDLWVLYNVVRKGDTVYALTTREVKPGEGGSSRRIPMVLGIRVENVEFQEFTDKLRIRGVIIQGPEEFGVQGKYHTVSIGIGDKITIIKEEWSSFDLEFITRYSSKRRKILVVSMDYEEACVAILAEQGIKYIEETSSNMPSKNYAMDYPQIMESYLNKLVETIIRVVNNEKPDALVIASIGDLKNIVKRKLEDHVEIPIYVDTVSTGGCKGVEEVTRRDIVKKISNELSIVKANRIFDEFKALLIKDPDLVAYGVEDVHYAVNIGAVEKLLIIDEYLRLSNYVERIKVYEILNKAHETRAEIIIVPRKSNIYYELASFGGVIAILRYKLERSLIESS